MVNEKNIINSFKLAKNDIMRIQDELFEISQKQNEIIKKINNLVISKTKLEKKLEKVTKKKPKTKTRVITKTVTKKAKKRFVGSKTGKKFHNPHCPFAKNIKPKARVIFKSKTTALNKGYRPCNCVK